MDKRIRSPNYPALSLPGAVDKVAAIYRTLHNHAAPRDVIAKAMGYAGVSGASATAISALRKYGLLDRVGEELKVSERALRILHPHSPAEKAEAVRLAAGEPELFAELTERFPDRPPNEDLLKNLLVRKGFAPAALASVILAYHETSEMVERENADYDSQISHSQEGSQMEPAPYPVARARPIQTLPQHAELQGDDRQIGRYDFEGGSYVRISAFGEIDTETALDMAEILIGLKRKELARKNKTRNDDKAVDNLSCENEKCAAN